MRSKISKNRIIRLSGMTEKGVIKTLPVLCVRKSCIRTHYKGRRKSRMISKLRNREVIGMVSHPVLTVSKTAPYVDGWCHPFRDGHELLPRGKPAILLSESDFIDSNHIAMFPKTNPKRDFYCFTMGGHTNRRRKGIDLLIRTLKVMTERGISGLIINYTNKNLILTQKEKKIFRQALKRRVKYKRVKLSPAQVAKVMAESRFGLFPNWQDCSPLMIPESLVRGTPVLVSERIYGGWKYINSQTGSFLAGDINKALDTMLDGDFSPREYFLDNYGFDRSARRFAAWGRQHFKGFKGIEKACFKGLARFLRG